MTPSRSQLHNWLDWIFLLDEVIPWYTGVVYKGHNLVVKEDGCLLIIKGMDKQTAVVAYYGGASSIEAFQMLASDISRHRVKWRADKYRK